MHLFIAGIFPEDCSLKELMTFEDSLLDAEAAHNNCFIYCRVQVEKCWQRTLCQNMYGFLFSTPPHNKSREMSPTLSFSVCVFFFPVLPKDTLIPYCGVLCLHEVNPQDPTVPITLLPGVEAGWNRMVELGHQPVVLEDGGVVRKFYNFTFAIAMKMLPIV